MSALVIAEHEAGQLKPSTLNTVSAALLVSHEVHVLVAGAGCAAVAQAEPSSRGGLDDLGRRGRIGVG
ncbi:MAG: hypothetical protein EBW84_12585 [Betaproteobacteria bacterium]|nr:hypothetical protein [Betaproteobacteria bacterium]